MYKGIDKERKPDDFDEEEKIVDPFVAGGFLVVFLSVISVILLPLLSHVLP